MKVLSLMSIGAVAIFIAVGGHAETKVEPLALTGQTFMHDPSSIVRDGGRYFVFGTFRGIRVRSSSNLVLWENEPPVFFQLPEWTKHVAPSFDGFFWAPDVVKVNERFFLYYSVSAWGKQTSAIGLAITPTLAITPVTDSPSTNYHWTDRGPVIQSTNGSAFNTIDPSVMLDADGKLWMSFGSFWTGIYLIELNPKTGLRADTNAPIRLAWNEKIEASCITRHDDFYYLFVNWGQCCRGTNSTYEVRIGRAAKITGPYLDRDGKNLVDGGGTKFLESTGRYIGPGHIGIFSEGGTNWFSYHYYDAETFGRSRLAIGQIQWTNGWPEAQCVK